MKLVSLLIGSVLVYTVVFAQQDTSSEINAPKLAIVSGVSASFIVAGHIQNYDGYAIGLEEW